MQTVWRTSAALAEFGRARLRTELKRGMWQRPERGVIVTHNGALSTRETVEVALAVCPPLSALGGVTALELDGFKSGTDSRPHIVLPEGGYTLAKGKYWCEKCDPSETPRLRTSRPRRRGV